MFLGRGRGPLVRCVLMCAGGREEGSHVSFRRPLRALAGTRIRSRKWSPRALVSVIVVSNPYARRNGEGTVRCDGRTTDEGYVALQAWLVGQLDPRTPHAADLFAQDSECLYDAFLSVLIGTGLGFIDYDDIRFHHGLYAFDFFVGDVHAPPRRGGADGPGESRAAGQPSPAVATPAMCHAIVDTWLGDVGRHIHFVASVIASVATLKLVARVRVDECVFELDLPPGYARSTANKPWEDGSLLIGICPWLPPVRSFTSRRARATRDRPCPPRALPRPWHRPCRWGSPWSRPLRSPSGPPPLCVPHTGALRCWAGPPTQWLEPCPRAGTPGECRSERASLTRRRRTPRIGPSSDTSGCPGVGPSGLPGWVGALWSAARTSRPRPRRL